MRVLLFSTLGVVFCLGLAFLVLNTRSYSEIEIKGGNIIETNLLNSITKVIKEETVVIFGKNVLLRKKGELQDSLSQYVFSEIVDISIANNRDLVVKVGGITPEVLVCEKENRFECVYVRRGSGVVLPAPRAEGGSVPVVVAAGDIDEILNKKTAYLLNLLDIAHSVEADISEIVVNPEGFYLRSKSLQGVYSQGFDLIFPPQQNQSDVSFKEVLQNVKSISDFWGTFTQTPDLLEYIDLRFEDRFIYKFAETS